ncbi:MAG TPA: BTAD domain-containing putative transcriptional regulator [Streptosporangiaceae bacterium]
MITHFRLLGSVEIVRRSRHIALPATKPSVVLATLLLHANEFVSTDRLIETVWGDTSPRNPRSTLQTYIMRLRQLLLENDMANCPIRTLPGGYSIDASAETLDLLRFHQLVERARRDGGDPVDESRSLKEAISLWRGPALANIPSEVLHREEVPKLTEQWLEAHERRIDIELCLNHHRRLIGELRWLTAAYPQRERFWEQLMEALYRSGRQSEALEEYRKIKSILLNQLGVDPGPGLQQMELAILKGEVTMTSVAPEPVTMPTGTVKGMGVQCRLPPEIPNFVGRGKLGAQIADELIQRVDRNEAIITAIHGAPGVGKSALALRVAYDVRDLFPDGQWYLRLTDDCGGARSLIDLLTELIQFAGLDPADAPKTQAGLESVYRMAMRDRRVLLLLDDAVDAEQVKSLLPGSSSTAVLVTSRMSLVELAAQWSMRSYELDVLSRESSLDLLMGMLDKQMIYGEEGAAMELAEICGHLPLALRIAAAKLANRPGQSLAEYVRWLASDPLARLSIGKRPSISVRRAFDASYHRLSGDAQRMLQSIGACVPGPLFTMDNVVELIGTPSRYTEEVLDELADAGLIRSPDPDHFSMPVLLHAYSRQSR